MGSREHSSFSSIFIAAQWRHHISIRYAEGTGKIGLSRTCAYPKNTKKLSKALQNLVKRKRDMQRAASKLLTWNSWLCKLPEMKRSYSTALVLAEYPHKPEIDQVLQLEAANCFPFSRKVFISSWMQYARERNLMDPCIPVIPLLPQTQMVSGRAGKEAWSLGALLQPSPNSWQWLNTVAQCRTLAVVSMRRKSKCPAPTQLVPQLTAFSFPVLWIYLFL